MRTIEFEYWGSVLLTAVVPNSPQPLNLSLKLAHYTK